MGQNQINHLIHSGLEKLGKTADAYLTNQDGRLLTETRKGEYQEDAALNESIDTKAVNRLKGPISNNNTDFKETIEYVDYEGADVLGILSTTKLGSRNVGLITTIDDLDSQIENVNGKSKQMNEQAVDVMENIDNGSGAVKS
ncbi:MAG: hypothetical protein U5K53_08915 [Halanaerobiales bacterium]|nr:hypothetical protein [Halanaerobiales bacterium]